MTNKLLQTYETLNLIQNKETNEQDFAWQPDARHDFDLVRFLNNQAYWKINLGPKEPEKKKIVLNNFRFLFSNDVHSFDQIFGFLISQGFVFYVRTGSRKFEVIDDIEKLNLETIEKTQLTDNETIYTELQAINEKPEDFLIFDHQSQETFYRTLVPYLGIDDDQRKKDLKQLHDKEIPLHRYNAILLSDNNINFLSRLASDKIITAINIEKLASRGDPQQVKLKWQPSTYINENRLLLQQIRNAFDPAEEHKNKILPFPSASYLQLVQSDVTDVNLTEFTHLEALEIFKSDQLVNINGLYKLKKLKELILEIENGINYKFSHFPLLKSLELYLQPEYDLQSMLENCCIEKLSLFLLKQPKYDLKGLSSCKNLRELALFGGNFSSIGAIHLPNLPNLNKLELNVSRCGQENMVFDTANAPVEELKIVTNSGKIIILHSNLKTLKKLSLSSGKISELQELLNGCQALEELDLSNVETEGLDLSPLKNLRSLKLYNCNNLDIIKGLNSCQNLEKINISTNNRIEGINLSSLRKLKKVSICCSNSDIKLPIQPESIEQLIIADVNNSEIDLAHYENVKKMTLRFSVMKDIKNLSDCKQLRTLHIRDVNISLLDLRNCNLDTLNLLDCKKLELINGLEYLDLASITISNCNKLKIPEAFNSNAIADCLISTPTCAHSSHDFIDSYIFLSRNTEQAGRYLKPLPIVYCDPATLELQLRKLQRQRQLAMLNSSYSDISYSSNFKKDRLSYPEGYHVPQMPKQYKLDQSTYTDPNITLTVPKIFSDNNNFKPRIETYRRSIYDHFNYDSRSLTIEQADLKPDLQPYKLIPAKPTDYSSAASCNCQIRPDQYFVLPGLSSNDDLIDFTPKNVFDIFKSKYTNQYVIKLKKSYDYPVNCYLKYRINTDVLYFAMGMLNYSKLDMGLPVPELPKQLKQKLDKLFSTNVILKKISLLLSNEEKIYALKDYCKFSNDELSDPFNIDDLEHFTLLIDERKGSCSHRSNAFMALCHYLKLPARIVISDCHSFVEVPIRTDKGTHWTGINLGGAEANLNVITSTQTPEWLDNINDADSGHPELENVQPISSDIDETLLSYFIPNEQYLSGCRNFRDAIGKLLLQDKAILFRTQSSSDVWQYYRALYDYYQEQKHPLVFIDSVDDLKALFFPVQIHATEEQTDRLYSRVDGPIKQLIQMQQGAILVNWENFSAHDKALYKSLIDDPATLNGLSISKNIRVFGVLPQDKKANDVFLSRNFRVKLPAGIIKEQQQITTQTTSLITKNLYHSNDWKSLLIHEFIPQGDAMQIKQGALLTAMENGSIIEVINPPHNREFLRTITRVQTEGKLFVNGKWIYAKNGFKILLREVPITLDPPKTICFEDHQETQGKYFHINADNFSSLFKEYHVDSIGRIFVIDGWLKGLHAQDKIIITTPLQAEQWQKLFDHLKSANASNYLHIYCLPGCAPELAKQDQEQMPSHTNQSVTQDYTIKDISSLLANNKSLHLKCNDPQFVAGQLQKQCQLKSDNIIYLTDENVWSNLIETIKPEIINHRLRAKRNESIIWEKLKNGETVVFCGNLSTQDYHSLQTLFNYPPYLYVNGKREEISGRLLWVSDHKPYQDNPLAKSYPIATSLDDYTNTLRQTIKNVDENNINSINLYFKCLRQLNLSDCMPNGEHFNYVKYRQMYHTVCQSSQTQNPFKHITQYFYRKNTEEYAYINVLAKVLLSNDNKNFVNKEKLTKLLANVHAQNDYNAQFWQILNCFSSNICRQWFKDIKNSDVLEQTKLPLPPAALSTLLLQELAHKHPQLLQKDWVCEILTADNYMEKDTPSKTHVRKSFKQKRAIFDAINDDKQQLIFLLGESGTGKTFTVKKLCNQLPAVDFYVSENKIANWLQPSTDGKKKILLLDEANLLSETHWEFLQGLFQNPPVVYYHGRPYPLSDKHKIILTGNPQYYPDRHFQQLAWDHAQVIWFGPFEENFVKNKIKNYLCQLDNAFSGQHDVQLISQILYNTYHYLEQSDQRVVEITLRDIENICARLILLQKKNNNLAVKANLANAIYTEISSILLNKEARQQFKTYLQKNCSTLPKIQPMHFKDNDMIIPPSKEVLWSLVHDDLVLRQMRIDLGRNSPGKLGLLLQGPSGIGKTTMYLKSLESMGYTYMSYPMPLDRQNDDRQHIYYHITAGSENTTEILLKAFHEGSVVVLDELNVEPELEQLLNQLLSGTDPDDQPAKVPGFMVLASQNPAYYDGCCSLSRALMNRFHEVNVKDYTKADLLYIAHEKHVPNPTSVVGTFFYCEKKYPDEVNTRNCFDVMDLIHPTIIKHRNPQ